MKRTILFIACVLMLVSCAKSEHDKAVELITDYIHQIANDPSSVQDVEVSQFINKLERDAHGHDILYRYVTVEFRAKNGYGALMKSESIVVKLDSACTQILCYDCFGY